MDRISIEHYIWTQDENAGLLSVTSPGSILFPTRFFINVVSSMPDLVLDSLRLNKSKLF